MTTGNKTGLLSFAIAMIAAMFLSGCATTYSVYYETEMDPNYTISRGDTVCIIAPDNLTVEHKKFMAIIEKKLNSNGFNAIKPDANQNCKHGLLSMLDTKSYTHTGSYTSYNTVTQNHSGFAGGQYYSGSSTTQVPTTQTYTSTSTYKKIYVDVVTRNAADKIETIWQGFASPTVDDYDYLAHCIINVMVRLIGSNTKGDLVVEDYCAESYFSKGESAMRRGEHKQAIIEYSRAIDLDPNFSSAYNNRGSTYMLLGDYDRALSDAKQACKLGQCELEQKLER
ncbi:hypothetical protein AGMMS50229_14480 [Campylobacterota bacterium]|nr:hypothetical protein AGMMS50229_14480 [Campylobacterota bacterium]